MIQLTPAQLATLQNRFLPDQPGPLIGLHVIRTGQGACFVDRWPDPQVVLTDTAGNISLTGDPAAWQSSGLAARTSGFLEAPPVFLPVLQEAFPDLIMWDRVIFTLTGEPQFALSGDYVLRRLTGADAYLLWGLSSDSFWVSKTWGGPAGLAASGYAWGVFADGQLVSVACTFFVGDRFEDIGIVTEPPFRGLGLGVMGAGAMCRDIQRRGRQPSWTTSPDNTASIRVAEKLGFHQVRQDKLYVIGISVPPPPVEDSA